MFIYFLLASLCYIYLNWGGESCYFDREEDCYKKILVQQCCLPNGVYSSRCFSKRSYIYTVLLLSNIKKERACGTAEWRKVVSDITGTGQVWKCVSAQLILGAFQRDPARCHCVPGKVPIVSAGVLAPPLLKIYFFYTLLFLPNIT